MRYEVDLKSAKPNELPDLIIEIEAESGTAAALRAVKPEYVVRGVRPLPLPFDAVAVSPRSRRAGASKGARS